MTCVWTAKTLNDRADFWKIKRNGLMTCVCTAKSLNEKADFLDWKAYFNRAFMEHLNRSLEEEYQDVTYAEEYIGTISIQLLFHYTVYLMKYWIYHNV